ncbi:MULTISPECIES: hypothetical protein [unclassified Neisseria]|uniref:hypothetical protein n=1 Tax=unclassified Neisseria TaxID=2623750 RepID=UPI002666EE49|nr:MULTISPECIES: hypothetical protein [unclassified Neisseria]MDO1509954.1 hypothetical protein [Neisseria sp. MVDL19-042950]MDO1516153.1 hypothetical protein [Neisseria sp. MVDL18-041461]MDO1563268.1 hypothetical protein [Neisseria sp. MVDL20-010259]
MIENKDPVLAALVRIEAKQEQMLENQQAMDEEIKEIRKECRKTAALYGGLGGMTVAAGWEMIKLKLGIGGG